MDEAKQKKDDINQAILHRSVGFLTRAAHLLERDLIRESGPAPLRFSTYSALAVISENPGILLRSLAVALQTKETNLAPIVASLEAEGMLIRKRYKTRRGIGHSLSAEGKALLEKSLPIMEGYDRDFAAALTDEEYAILTKLLTKLVLSRTPRMPESQATRSAPEREQET